VRSCGRPSREGFLSWRSDDFYRSGRKTEAASVSAAWWALDAEERIERAMKDRDRALTPLSEVERIHGKPVGHGKLEPGRAYQGRVVAMVSDAEGRAYVVLDTDPTLTAIPALNRRPEVGQEIYARAVTQEVVAGERRWTLAWQIDDLEQERKRDRGRER
jgi:hypothetical protein